MTIYFADGTNQATAGGGKILQVKAGTKTGASSYSPGENWVDIGLDESITPSNSGHKILIQYYIGKIATNDWSGATRLVRGSTYIARGSSASSRQRISTSFPRSHDDNHWGGTSMMWLDSPSTTSSVTYKVQVQATSAGILYINRGHGDSNNDDIAYGRSASAIILMEVD